MLPFSPRCMCSLGGNFATDQLVKFFIIHDWRYSSSVRLHHSFETLELAMSSYIPIKPLLAKSSWPFRLSAAERAYCLVEGAHFQPARETPHSAEPAWTHQNRFMVTEPPHLHYYSSRETEVNDISKLSKPNVQFPSLNPRLHHVGGDSPPLPKHWWDFWWCRTRHKIKKRSFFFFFPSWLVYAYLMLTREEMTTRCPCDPLFPRGDQSKGNMWSPHLGRSQSLFSLIGRMVLYSCNRLGTNSPQIKLSLFSHTPPPPPLSFTWGVLGRTHAWRNMCTYTQKWS